MGIQFLSHDESEALTKLTDRPRTQLPVLHLEGTPYEQGHQYGSLAWKRIERNIELYFKRFTEECGLSEGEVFQRAEAYWQAIKQFSEPYAEAIRGMAIGSGYELMRIVALNVRYEIIYHQFVVNSFADGCSSMAVSPDRSMSGHLIMGENWDWFRGVEGVILHTQDHGVETLSFSEAGIIGGKIGLNSHGLGLAINGLNSTIDNWAGLHRPFHLLCYEILRSRFLRDAVEIVTTGSRSCSANFLIAQINDKIVNVETAPLTTRIIHPEEGFIAHTNHFLDPALLNIEEPDTDVFEYSSSRLQRIQLLADCHEQISLANLAEILRDHEGEPYALCRHADLELKPSKHYESVVSILMDLHAQSMWIAEGLPCSTDYVKHSLIQSAVSHY